MALTQSTESTSKLIDYLSYIGMILTSSDQDEASSDSEPNVEIGELFGQMLGHAEEQGLFNSRQALQHTLEAIGAGLTEAGPDFDKLALMPLLDALKAYLQEDEPELQVKTIVAYLPEALSDNYAEMLFTEAALLSGKLESGATATAHSAVPLATITNAQNDAESTSPADDADALTTRDAALSPAGQNISQPIQAALNLAVEEFHALLNSESSMPDKESLQALLQDHLGNLEFIAETADAHEFLHSLESLQNWATKELRSQQVENGTFLSELLVKLADLPFDRIDQDEYPASDAEAYHSHDETTVETFTDDRLAMLYEELSEFDEQLKEQALILTTEETGGEALIDCIDSYSELLGRLNSACEALGLQGLGRVCNFVIENVNLLPAQQISDRLMVRPLLIRWPEIVKLYLSDPADDSTLMGLIDLLQDAAWPNRFDGLDSRDLYAELSSGATEEDELTSEEPRLTQATVEDISLELSADINPQLFDAFMIESPDVAAHFNQVISSLATADNPFEGMRSVQRLSHTLKGSANLVGIKGIANLAHYIEDILDTLTRRHLAPSSSLITVLHEAADCLESMIDTVAGKEHAPDNALAVLQQVLDIANLVDSGDYDSAADVPLSKTDHAIKPAPAVQTPSSTTTPVSAGAETIRVPTATVDAMFRLVEEITISLAQVNEHVNRVKQRSESLNLHDRNLQQRRFDLENLVDVRSIAAMQKRLHKTRQGFTKFDPLEMDQYDELHGATHSYIEAVADAREISSVLHDAILELDSFMLRQSRLNKELQQLVSATRMVPVSDISSRLQRAVRQASRATGNVADLIIDDQNLMMDGDVLNKLVDPLLHILRNAVDHGMSHADASSESGQITIRFLQEGSNVVIRCKDNGKGLDYPRIREVAIERGMLRPEQNPANEELASLIMSPSFTTRSATTQVSGRGIGMDAVFTVITELKGTISVHDVEPHGTEFVIRLPLSLVTTHSLVVQSGTEVYAIPSTTLSQILSPGTGEIQQSDEGYTFRLEREMFAMRFLTALLGYNSDATPESATILLTGRGTTPAAIAVDAVLQSTELVIKRLGRFVPKVTGVAGISVLGDGRVIPVLDLPELLLASQEETSASPMAPPMSAIHPLRQVVGRPTALVVDDSLSARNSLSQLLEDSGYAVLTARDGIEAVELLQAETPLVVLADMEMPRMDGIELTRHIRSSDQLQRLPVVMITSRSQKKHRQEAESAGVSAYLTKPFIDDELIDVITALV